jgi:hypothetical protein
MVLRKTLQKTYYGIQRNMERQQLYAVRRLDAIDHATLGPRGIAARAAYRQCWLLSQNHGCIRRLALHGGPVREMLQESPW